MSSSFSEFSDGEIIHASHVTELHEPIQRLESGAAFYASVDTFSSSSTAYSAALEPEPAPGYSPGLMVNLKIPATNATGSPDVTLELNGLGPKPILKGDGQSLEAGDLLGDQMVTVVYDDAGSGAFRLVSSGSSGSSGPLTWDDLGLDEPVTNSTSLGRDSLAANTGDQNTAVGWQALQANTEASYNTAVGCHALESNLTGEYNVAVGANALSGSTEASSNTAIGADALRATTTGYSNSALGQGALVNNTTGYCNQAFGNGALASNTEGVDNVAIGHTALYQAAAASNNIAIGSYAMQQNLAGSENVAIGREAMFHAQSSDNVAIGYISQRDNTEGGSNTAVGYGSLTSNSTGNGNCAFGREALYLNLGSNNCGLGVYALQNNQGDSNCAIGGGCLQGNTTGYFNVALGASAMISNTTGFENCAFGTSALGSNADGVRNISVGTNSAVANVSGSNNVSIGCHALAANTDGNNNTTLGYYAGATLTTGSGNIVIGSNIDVAEAGEDNQINIGNCILRNGPRQNASLRAGSSAYADASDTAVVDLSNLRGWIGFCDDADGWCRLRVNPGSIVIEASSADWVASATPSAGEVGLYLSGTSLQLVLGTGAARNIGFTDNTVAF